jgi:hypothetical protein
LRIGILAIALQNGFNHKGRFKVPDSHPMLSLRLAMISAALLAASYASADELCGRSFTSVQQLYADLTRTSGIQAVLNDDSYIAFADPGAKVMWTFTKTSHPAAPAVLCRRPVQTGDRIEVQLQARRGGAKAACDALIAAFQALPR